MLIRTKRRIRHQAIRLNMMVKKPIEPFTDEEIANACNNYVSDWDIETLVSFAYDEMYKYYKEHPEHLAEFMKDNS